MNVTAMLKKDDISTRDTPPNITLIYTIYVHAEVI